MQSHSGGHIFPGFLQGARRPRKSSDSRKGMESEKLTNSLEIF